MKQNAEKLLTISASFSEVRLGGADRMGLILRAALGECRSSVKHETRLALGLGLVHRGNLAAVRFTFSATFLGGFDTADTAPALASLGIDQAHLFLGMMRPAVVAKGSFRHASTL